MTNLEADLSTIILGRLEQIEQQQILLRKYIVGLKRYVDNLNENFNSRTEGQQIESLRAEISKIQDKINNIVDLKANNNSDETISGTLDNDLYGEIITVDRAAFTIDYTQTYQQIIDNKIAIKPEIIQPIVNNFKNELVCDNIAIRRVLIEALNKARVRLILVSPWLSKNSINDEIIENLKGLLNRKVFIDIGWGSWSDRSEIGTGLRYNALENLLQLQTAYPDKFRLKLLGTHENFLVCIGEASPQEIEAFAMISSHNFFASPEENKDREIAIRTTDTHIIQKLIQRFEEAETIDVDIIRQEIAIDSLDTTDDAAEIEYEDIEENTEEINEINQEPPISAEEFLQQYQSGERDFSGINLSGAILIKQVLHNKINLSKANLKSVSLSETNLQNSNLSEANLDNANLYKTYLGSANLVNAKLRGVNLIEANLYSADLSNADLSHANLTQVIINSAKFKQAKLIKANLSQIKQVSGVDFSEADMREANLSKSDLSQQVNLINANLTKANLSESNLRKANFIKANLSNANLSKTNLLEANLTEANLKDANLQQALCNPENFPQDFDFTGTGAYLITPGSSLEKAELSGVDLKSVNLSEANLTEANLREAQLNNANLNTANLSKANLANTIFSSCNLNYANLSWANLKDAHLNSSKLRTANLTQADLRGANLNHADLSGAELVSADLRAANLTYANLSGADLTGAKIGGANLQHTKLTGTIMPDGSIHQ